MRHLWPLLALVLFLSDEGGNIFQVYECTEIKLEDGRTKLTDCRYLGKIDAKELCDDVDAAQDA